MTWDETIALLTPCLPDPLSSALLALSPDSLMEIRIRADRDAQLCCRDGMHTVSLQVSQEDVARICEALTGHSLYARSEEISMGYVTLRGGHRLGLCGSVHIVDGKTHLQRVYSVCLRIAASHPGCSESLFPSAGEGMLIIGPPASGKTTLLRDLARLVSLSGKQTAVIDERCELSACLDGTPQLDIGCADVLCGLSKPEAASWLIRSMSPEVIVTDEISREEDAEALLDAHACGVQIIASIHGRNLNEAVRRNAIKKLVASRTFGTYTVLSSVQHGCITAMYDRNGSPLL